MCDARPREWHGVIQYGHDGDIIQMLRRGPSRWDVSSIWLPRRRLTCDIQCNVRCEQTHGIVKENATRLQHGSSNHRSRECYGWGACTESSHGLRQ